MAKSASRSIRAVADRAAGKSASPSELSALSWRSVLCAAACAAVTYIAMAGGLVSTLPEWQIAILPGVVAGVSAASLLDAAAGALVGVGFAAVAVPSWFIDPAAAGDRYLWALVFAGAAAAVAAGLAWLFGRPGGRWRFWAAAAGLVLVIGNGLYTAATVPSQIPVVEDGSTLQTWLNTPPQPRGFGSDEAQFLRTIYLVREGTPYYEAFRQSSREDTANPGEIPGVFGYRQPWLTWVWAYVLSPSGLPMALAVLWSLGCAAWFAAVAARFRSVSDDDPDWRPGLPLAASLAMSTTLLAYGAFYFLGLRVTFAEAWAGALGVLSVAAFLVAAWRKDFAWNSVAVGLAVLAAMSREHMAMLLVAGLAVSLLEAGWRRRRLWIPWVAGLAAYLATYAWHAAQVPKQAGTAGGFTLEHWLHGGPPYVWSMLTVGGNFLGAEWVLPALALLGILGLLLAPRGYREFMAVAAVAPLVLYMFVGPDIRVAGVATWGATVVPLLLTATTFALTAIGHFGPPLQRPWVWSFAEDDAREARPAAASTAKKGKKR